MSIKKEQPSKVTLRKFIGALFEKETPKYIKVIVGLALVYTVFPLDILPDIFGFLGFADDIAVISILTTVAMSLLDNFYIKQTENTPSISS